MPPQRLLSTVEYIKHIDGTKEKAAQWKNEWLAKIVAEAQSIMVEENLIEHNKKKPTCITSFLPRTFKLVLYCF